MNVAVTFHFLHTAYNTYQINTTSTATFYVWPVVYGSEDPIKSNCTRIPRAPSVWRADRHVENCWKHNTTWHPCQNSHAPSNWNRTVWVYSGFFIHSTL